MSDMSDATLLNELCSICNTNKSKYRCPACSARTCSLPCYKRHQQWAQCSGQRDPTKFMKKSQLVTPAGIDHDFNFLSGVERNLEKAEKVASTAFAGAPSEAKSKSQRAGVQFSKLEAAAGVNIIRAPQGLSRQKENKSHLSSTKRARQNAVWTIEWFDHIGQRVLTETSSTQHIKDAQPFVRHGTGGKAKKRKLNTEEPTTSKPSQAQDQDQDHPQIKDVAPSTSEDQIEPLQRLKVNSKLQVNDAKPERVSPRRASSPREQQDQASKRHTDMAETHTRGPSHDGPDEQPVGHGQHRYFLLKPRTSTSRRVLIPLEPCHTIAESLRGRTLLEFPTIYMFPTSVAPLPDEFMLEEEYLLQEGEEAKEFDDLMKELDPEMLRRLKEGDRAGQQDQGAEEQLDGLRILDMLKRDLGADGL
ncbi:HIT finger domain-containing protein [Decorospora gaudefroyi]|uniref:Box C/D snoRNA protein 1 n=1 Tax=Decorospora gaudefroyi TaxID=184978 RepID=A0A6A5K2J0_9PLEO|nr:HIT finger domain-containing protein [Decorospora gaudefroyi]